jgi:hypothetical protein
MAAGIPDPIERRNLLHLPQKKPVDFAAYAERYLALGRKSDALDFADKAPAEQRADLVRRIREQAVALGDAFLLGRLDAVDPLPEPQREKTWRDAFDIARKKGKLRHALKLAKKLGDAAEVAKLEEQLGIAKPPLPLEAAAAHAGHDHDHAPPGSEPPSTV